MIQKIDAVDPINSKFDFYGEVVDPASLDFSSSDVDVVEWSIGGTDGQGGVDVKVFKEWCTCVSSYLDHLWKDISHW